MPRPPKAVLDALRWLASQGGKARAKGMTREERSRAMSAAVTSRWKKTPKAKRSAAARKAALARWAKKARPPK